MNLNPRTLASELALPLTKLLHKDNKFAWSEECEAFEELKQCLVLAPVLTIPEGSKGFILYSNASRQGFGCVLMGFHGWTS